MADHLAELNQSKPAAQTLTQLTEGSRQVMQFLIFYGIVPVIHSGTLVCRNNLFVVITLFCNASWSDLKGSLEDKSGVKDGSVGSSSILSFIDFQFNP